MPAVDDTSFAAAKSRVETALGFVKSLTRAQLDGAENKVIAWTGGANQAKMSDGAHRGHTRPSSGALVESNISGNFVGYAVRAKKSK